MKAAGKLDKECRVYNADWNNKYFVRLHTNSSDICVICNTVINVIKEYSIRRHCTTRHSNYDKYTGRERDEKYADLMKNLTGQQHHFTKHTGLSEKARKVVSELVHWMSAASLFSW